MIGKRAESVINKAVSFAMEHAHEYFTLEHVLWSLVKEEDVADVIEQAGGDSRELLEKLESYLLREIPRMSDGSSPAGEQPVATLAVQRLIQRALFQVQSSGKDEIKPLDLLVAMFQAKDSQALYLLNKQGLDRLKIIEIVAHGVRSTQRNEDERSEGDDESESQNSRGRSGGRSGGRMASDPLKEFAVNLNERAKKGKIDPIFGRDSEIERMIQILSRRQKNNPLLVGEAGVGKTALAEGLASRIVEGTVPPVLKNATIYALDFGTLVAGAKFRGDFEQRLKKVLEAVEGLKERGEQPILFIDEIHTMIGAGSVSGNSLDAANLLKPALARGELRCIGSTTYTEFRNVFEKDAALTRRFQKVDVNEPSQEDAIRILHGLKGRFETFHGVTYSDEAIRSAVELSVKHLTDRFLPDKAIDLMDEAGAKKQLLTRASLGAVEAAGDSDSEPPTISTNDIEELVAQIARIPARSVSSSQKERLKTLDKDLKLSIFGQDEAIEKITAAIRLARSGLRSGEKPVGSFLFCGPTGVGKTELSKQLAHALGVPFLRYDMSEYAERHTVSRLIGAPPGYVGFDQQGMLTSAVQKNPYAVVLLDEIEKAHPEIWNILLQVMDHGVLTDTQGRKVDFKNVILLLTSNVGSRDMEKRSLGLAMGGAPVGRSGAEKAVEQTFSPEFRNRLDAIIYFNSLDPITIGHIVGKNIVELESQLLAKKVDLEIDSEVRTWLAEKGFDRLLGARPLQRLIQEEIKKPLSEHILFGELEDGGFVKVFMKEGKIAFTIKKREATERSEPSKAIEDKSS